MQHTNQYYFSVEKLELLLSMYKAETPDANKDLTGFVFTPGYNASKEPVVYAFPMYSETMRTGKGGDLLMENLNAKLTGCPYPPKCN